MTLPHVSAGEVARAAEQNELVDAVNGHTTAIGDAAATFGEHDSRLSTVETNTSGIDSMRATLYGSSTRTTVPQLEIRKTADQSVPYQTDVWVTWDAEVEDTANMWATAAPQDISVPFAGRWFVKVALLFKPITGASGAITAKLCTQKSFPPNSALESATGPMTTAGEGTLVTMVGTPRLAANSKLYVGTWHSLYTTTGQTAVLHNVFAGCRMQVIWRGP